MTPEQEKALGQLIEYLTHNPPAYGNIGALLAAAIRPTTGPTCPVCNQSTSGQCLGREECVMDENYTPGPHIVGVDAEDGYLEQLKMLAYARLHGWNEANKRAQREIELRLGRSPSRISR